VQRQFILDFKFLRPFFLELNLPGKPASWFDPLTVEPVRIIPFALWACAAPAFGKRRHPSRILPQGIIPGTGNVQCFNRAFNHVQSDFIFTDILLGNYHNYQ